MKDKIRKLLAMAQDMGASEQERETASRQAAKLMAKHDIDLADLEEQRLKEEFDLTTVEATGCRPGKRNAQEVPPWIGFMAWGIKLYTGTRMRSGAGIVYFYGPREDVELAQWMLNTLVKQAYDSSKGQPHPNAYRNGYGGAIQHRLKQMVKDRDAADSEGGNQLVIFQGKRERIMEEAFGPERGARKSSAHCVLPGHKAGMNASIPTNRPITNTHLRLN